MCNQTVVIVTSSRPSHRQRIVEIVRASIDQVEVVEADPHEAPPTAGLQTAPVLELVDAETAWLAVERRREYPSSSRHRCAVVAEGDTLIARRLTMEPTSGDGWTPLPALLDGLWKELKDEDGSRKPRQATSPSTEFLSRMSHELRTPLNAILGFAQLLQMDELAPEQKESVDHIVTAGRHLLALVNETLDISRVESGRMHLNLIPVVAAEAVQQAMERLRSEADAADVSLACAEGDTSVLADRERLQQILYHLLSNAVAYNRPGGTVVVGFELPAPGRTRIVVRDTGVGIPAERMSRLFSPFDRLGAEQSNVRGTGLGLTLVKRLVEAMGGEVGAESEVGVGSTFWVELADWRRQNGYGSEPRATPLGHLQLGHILYVEDNRDNYLLIQRLLGSLPGTTLSHAGTAAEASKLVATETPNLVLLDLNLPDATGEEVLQHLREDASTATVPVIAISADASPQRRDRVLGLGVTAYLTKPLDIGHFSDALEACNLDRRTTR